jgi:4-hydroxyacetophenone monooxygenase
MPITDDDATIRRALEDAFLPALLPALAHATGDMSLLREDLRPPEGMPSIGVEQAGMSAAQQAAAKEIAFEAIKKLRDEGPRQAPESIEDEARIISRWMTGSAASDEYLPMLLEQLSAAGDPTKPEWTAEPGTPFFVAIIGAGMSGLLAAIRLKYAGIPYVIIEKNAEVGGTWYENQYPGARVDVPSISYSYSFAQKIDWPKYFSPQGVLLDYFRDVADEYGVRENIRFNTEVVSAKFSDDKRSWSLQLKSPDGSEETLEANAIVAATGQLNRPRMPQIPGMDSFAGPAFHSARWDKSVDLKGKRVCVIGTGASAAQFVPEIAKDAAELTIFQRTPGWFVPAPTYHEDIPEGLLWLFTHIPHYMHWYRFFLFWVNGDGLLAGARVDESWPHLNRSVSEFNEQLRVLLGAYLQAQYAGRPDLLEKSLPKYPPASKRMIIENGIWAETIKKDNVHLVTEPIDKITPTGVVTKDGVEHPADVLIYGTGFQASHFLTPMTVTGRNGIDINKQWDGDARAYMGITVPNFPNFYMLYGPNTNIVVNGSIIFFSECEVNYVMGCLRLLLDTSHKAMDCRMDVHDAYNERIDAGNKQMAWGASTVNTWYKNEKGRITQNWPFDLIEFWRQTREPNPADYVFL